MINKVGFSTRNFTHNNQPENNLSFSQKAAVLGSSAIGAGIVIAGLAKHNNFSLNPAKIIKTPLKDWALFKYKKGSNAIEFEEPQIIAVASGSVVGGFVGGTIVDKKNRQAKKREILNQILGNVLVPVTCVGSISRIFSKYSDKIVNMMPVIKNETKPAKIFNRISRSIPNTAITVVSLGIGIVLGNKVSNFINEKLYHKKVERNIKATDFAPHVDDLCMALSLMNKDSDFGTKLGRIIPLMLLVPGYETGTAVDTKPHQDFQA